MGYATTGHFKILPVLGYILALKCLIFLIDPNVMFFLGDSASYIQTALTLWIPPDRSFLYGVVINILTALSHSLTSLVFFQIICSGISAICVGYLLNRFLSVEKGIAIFFSFICAIEPLQLMYERYVMSETLSLLMLSLYLIFTFRYFRTPKIKLLFIVNILGLFLIAFRLSFLSVIIVGAVFIPLIAHIDYIIDFFKKICSKTKEMGAVWDKKKLAAFLMHLIISCGLVFGLLESYKYTNGYISEKKPALSYADGFFLISSWAPIIESQDFPDEKQADMVLNNLKCDLKDITQREQQHFWKGCLVQRMIEVVGDRTEANDLAHEVAMNALERNPLGVVELGIKTYLRFWDPKVMRASLHWDRGERTLPDAFLKKLSTEFYLSGSGLPKLKTLTNRYFYAAAPWYYVLLLLPLFILIALFFDWRVDIRYMLYIGIISCLVLLASTSLVSRCVVRYLHPLAWLGVLTLGVLTDRLFNRRS